MRTLITDKRQGIHGGTEVSLCVDDATREFVIVRRLPCGADIAPQVWRRASRANAMDTFGLIAGDVAAKYHAN